MSAAAAAADARRSGSAAADAASGSGSGAAESESSASPAGSFGSRNTVVFTIAAADQPSNAMFASEEELKEAGWFGFGFGVAPPEAPGSSAADFSRLLAGLLGAAEDFSKSLPESPFSPSVFVFSSAANPTPSNRLAAFSSALRVAFSHA